MDQLEKLWPAIQVFINDYKIVIGFISYSIIEYYFGKTDRVKEGSLMEFVWARVKGLFVASKGIPNDPNKP